MKKIRLKVLFMLSVIVLSGLNLQAQTVQIIPRPQTIVEGQGVFVLNPEVKIVSLPQSAAVARMLQGYLKEALGVEPGLTESEAPGKGIIQFRYNESFAKEQYELLVAAEGVQIVASTPEGWFYGVQSFRQLLPSIDAASGNAQPAGIQALTVKDSPRFSWRAFMLDDARYFKGKEQVKLLLDEMALLKMNVFHWHLVDDQGWRIEIKKYPLLTEIGSKRKSTQIGPSKWNSTLQSGEPHEGFYTQEEIKEIVNYAAARYITVVPEIEMPGHSTAAIASYAWLGVPKKPIEMPTRFGVSKDIYDVSDPKVYQFLTDVLDEVMALFPSNVIHIGGDEVKYDQWKASAAVQAYMKEQKLATPAELQVFFTNRISQYLKSKGRRMMGWNEILGQNIHDYQSESDTKSNQQLAKESVIHFWRGDIALAVQAVSNGYEIVNSLHSNTYLDYDYKSIPLSKAYAFDPVPEGLDAKYHRQVIGTGCQMWGEWIPTAEQMHQLVFPRLAAYAEVGWTEKNNKDFDSFKLGLKKLQTHWKQKGISYAPDSVVEGGAKK